MVLGPGRYALRATAVSEDGTSYSANGELLLQEVGHQRSVRGMLTDGPVVSGTWGCEADSLSRRSVSQKARAAAQSTAREKVDAAKMSLRLATREREAVEDDLVVAALLARAAVNELAHKAERSLGKRGEAHAQREAAPLLGGLRGQPRRRLHAP